jgi:glycosyltransferase involved in cell wall biosynthesis
MVKLSIITVVYNNFTYIEDTILNVLKIKGNHDTIEYIIIDGGSTDGTISVIEKYKTKISLFVTEPDKGIYDAMNKGVQSSKGEWMIFMNSGDLFYENESDYMINFFSNNNEINNIDIIYGNTLTKNEKKIVVLPKVINANFFFLNTICHQSIFFNRKIFYNIGNYDLRYKIIADRDLLFRVANANGKFYHLDKIISVWDEEGFSKDNIKLFKTEENLFIRGNFTFTKRNYLLFKVRFGNALKKILRKI